MNLDRITTKGKAIFLAYDQGLEHGPIEFNLDNVDPSYIIDIAKKGNYNGIVFQHGIAEKYYPKKKQSIPLILKLNGKTKLPNMEPMSRQVCSVKRAINLGAEAVGYTLYIGSESESEQFQEFGKIVEEAHHYHIPVIAWIYPRGKAIHKDTTTEVLAYAARVALELGADIVKIKYNNEIEGFKWVVESAGKTKVVVAGGSKMGISDLLKQTYDIMQAGASGIAIGRNIWQHKDPLKITKALKSIIFNHKTPEEAKKYL